MDRAGKRFSGGPPVGMTALLVGIVACRAGAVDMGMGMGMDMGMGMGTRTPLAHTHTLQATAPIHSPLTTTSTTWHPRKFVG